jgi:hypothetical protein
VIATGLEPEEPVRDNVVRPVFGVAHRQLQAAVGATPPYDRPAVRQTAYDEAAPFPRPPRQAIGKGPLADLDIPTFIRRQMD